MALLERESLLNDLEEILLAAAAGPGQLVLLGGEAGVGKTSVVAELVRRVEGNARSFVGASDAVSTPRPLGPIEDIAVQTGGKLKQILHGDISRTRVFWALLDELTCSQPTLMVIEDVHWADEATLDLIRFLGRRVGGTHGLVLVTYRDDEVGPIHPLRLLLGDLTTSPQVRRMSIWPLSESGVRALVGNRAFDPCDLHRLTGGNPFFLSEVLETEEPGVPETVQDAVLARAARLSGAAREVLAAAAVMGSTIESWILTKVAGVATSAIDECLSSGMLRVDGAALVFRHELSREAIVGRISPSRLIELHQSVLRELVASPNGIHDPARLAHHAEVAHDTQAVVEYAVAAARQAFTLCAHRQEAAQYARAFRFGAGLIGPERANLLESYAYALSVLDEGAAAIAARLEALEIWRSLGNQLKEGENLYLLSTYYWLVGRNLDAEQAAQEALAVLEPLGNKWLLGRAYINICGLRMLARATDQAISWGDRAIALARETNDTQTLAQAMNYVGTARLVNGRDQGRELLEQSLQMSLAAELAEHVGRAYTNLGTGLGELRAYEDALGYLEDGIVYCGDNDLDHYRRYMEAWRAKCLLHQGKWSEATAGATRVLRERSISPISRITALYVLGRIRARRGDPEVAIVLDEALELALQTNDIQRVGPVRAARAEAAWLAGNPAQAIAEATSEFERAITAGDRWLVGELAYWLWKAGDLAAAPEIAAEPFSLQIAGNSADAAASWDSVGCPYDAARARAEMRDEVTLRQAWAEFDRLGARPAAAGVMAQLREIGAENLPRGPRQSTRDNAALLTAREMDVLQELSIGRSNPEIAQHLFLSPKTVEHHVSAILAKLEVPTRKRAVVEANSRGLLFQDRDATNPI